MSYAEFVSVPRHGGGAICGTFEILPCHSSPRFQRVGQRLQVPPVPGHKDVVFRLVHLPVGAPWTVHGQFYLHSNIQDCSFIIGYQGPTVTGVCEG